MSDSFHPPGLLCPWDFLGKNTGVGCHFLLQGIFPTQGSNSSLFCLLHWQGGSLPVVPPGRPVSLADISLKVLFGKKCWLDTSHFQTHRQLHKIAGCSCPETQGDVRLGVGVPREGVRARGSLGREGMKELGMLPF